MGPTDQSITEQATDVEPIEADTLVEEISIDGMCGVY
jgi:mycofactocin precursor